MRPIRAILAKGMSALEKRQRWLHRLQNETASLVASLPENERPIWPSHADMESMSKRQWERMMRQLRVRLRELAHRAGVVRVQPMSRVTLGPFDHREVTFANWLVQFFLFFPAPLQSELLALVRPKVRALVHFMCADRSGGQVRAREHRRGLRELGIPTIYQI